MLAFFQRVFQNMSRRNFFQIFCMFYLQCITRKCRLVQRTSAQNPSLRLQAIVEEIFRHIYFLEANSAHKQYQNWAHRNMYKNLPKRFVHEGFGKCQTKELGQSNDEPTRSVRPAAKGKQSLTLKRHIGAPTNTIEVWDKRHIGASTNTIEV